MNSIRGFKWCILIQERKLHTTYVKCFTYLFPLFELGCCVLLGRDLRAHNNTLGGNLCLAETRQGLLSLREGVPQTQATKLKGLQARSPPTSARKAWTFCLRNNRPLTFPGLSLEIFAQIQNYSCISLHRFWIFFGTIFSSCVIKFLTHTSSPSLFIFFNSLYLMAMVSAITHTNWVADTTCCLTVPVPGGRSLTSWCWQGWQFWRAVSENLLHPLLAPGGWLAIFGLPWLKVASPISPFAFI